MRKTLLIIFDAVKYNRISRYTRVFKDIGFFFKQKYAILSIGVKRLFS